MTARITSSPATALAALVQGLSSVRGVMLLALAVLGVAAVACGGSSQPSVNQSLDTTPQDDAAISPILTNNTLAVGQNRFSLMLVDQENVPIIDAAVGLRFFDLNDDEPVEKSQSNARFIASELFYADAESGERIYVESNIGVYVTGVDFDVPGRWSVDISVTTDGSQLQLVPLELDVLEKSPEPAVGDPVPASHQLTVADVTDIREIDSSFEPRPHMHDITITDALAAGRPIVVAFATPAFCTSRTCSPVMDTVMDPLYEKYQDRATFIHVEPLLLKEFREGKGRIHVQAAKDWGIETEPWMFVIDRQGMLAGKFEGIIAMDEVEDILAQALEG
jgi:hypothetical protein